MKIYPKSNDTVLQDCLEKNSWLLKQENIDWRNISKKLYNKGDYPLCLQLLYKKTSFVPFVIWFERILSAILIVLSFSLSLTYKPSNTVVAVATGATGLAVVIGTVSIASMASTLRVVKLIVVIELIGLVGMSVVGILAVSRGIINEFMMVSVTSAVGMAVVTGICIMGDVARLICLTVIKRWS